MKLLLLLSTLSILETTGQTVKINNPITLSATGADTYWWRFGDGLIDQGQRTGRSVTYTYRQPGVYVVTCIGWRIISTHFNTKRERKFLKEKIAWAFYFQNFTATTTIKIAAAMPTPAFICGVQKEEDKTEPPLDKTDKGIYANISAPCIGLGFTKTLTEGGFDEPFCGVGSASITSPTFQEYVLRPTTPPTLTCVENGFEKVYFAIRNLFCFSNKDTIFFAGRIFSFKNFPHKTINEAIHPLADNYQIGESLLRQSFLDYQ